MAPQKHPVFVSPAPKQRTLRAKKEKAANPRRGSRVIETEQKAKEEKDKDADPKEEEAEITEKGAEITEKETELREKETGRKTKEAERKVPEVPTPSSRPAEQPSVMGSGGATTPRAEDGELMMMML